MLATEGGGGGQSSKEDMRYFDYVFFANIETRPPGIATKKWSMG